MQWYPKWGRVVLKVTFTEASYNAQGGNTYKRVIVTWESGNAGCWDWVAKEGLFEQKTFEMRRCQLLKGRAFHGERNSKCKGLEDLLFWGISGMNWKWEGGYLWQGLQNQLSEFGFYFEPHGEPSRWLFYVHNYHPCLKTPSSFAYSQ